MICHLSCSCCLDMVTHRHGVWHAALGLVSGALKWQMEAQQFRQASGLDTQDVDLFLL